MAAVVPVGEESAAIAEELIDKGELDSIEGTKAINKDGGGITVTTKGERILLLQSSTNTTTIPHVVVLSSSAAILVLVF